MINTTLEEKYFTIKEIAKLLKVSYITIFRWIHAGKLIAVKAGKQYRIKESQLNKFLQNENEAK